MEIYNRIDDIDAIIVKLDGTVVYSKGMQRARDAQMPKNPPPAQQP
jgi:hypothetical protein